MNMTGLGRYTVHTADMDLIALARTIQDDKTRAIEDETRRRRLLSPAPTTGPNGPLLPRTSHSLTRSTSAASPSR